MSKEMKYEAVNAAKTGIYLARLRRQAGYTQVEAARKLHVSNKAVSKWESGKGLPEIGILPAIAALYGVTVDEILAGESLPGRVPSSDMSSAGPSSVGAFPSAAAEAESGKDADEADSGKERDNGAGGFALAVLAEWILAVL